MQNLLVARLSNWFENLMEKIFQHMQKMIAIAMFIWLMAVQASRASAQTPSLVAKRKTISLNGTWSVAEGGMNTVPTAFNRTVPVPGLLVQAQPAFTGVGPAANNPPSATNLQRSRLVKDTLREAFWYKRIFRIEGAVSAVATLKVAKAMFGTKALLNGVDLGEHLPSFTPGYFNAAAALKKGDNELLIRIGADRSAVPRSMPDGFDFEKDRYIPGIYDNVELILSGTPAITNVQIAPDIRTASINVQVELQRSGAAKSTALNFVVSEWKTKKVVASFSQNVSLAATDAVTVHTASVPVPDAKHWSPESPFLYNLQVTTDADELTTRFGMREFYFDTITKTARLNGKPYFLRGSNITLLRFFEDPDCTALPWDAAWVRKLHKGFKNFHWNSLRYCIGFPPEQWYEIADEEGILIQDEFPIWYGGKTWSVWPKELRADELAKQYTAWMRDRWNHPCVVIWDASNETYSEEEELAKAVEKVRSLDLSNRPWDNGYSPLRQPGDVYEAHPYHFQNPDFKLKDMVQESPLPKGNEGATAGTHPIIINEYGWLWLNRDGQPTTLTRKLYNNLLGESATAVQRRTLYAKLLAAETEFWRCHRQVAGVLHFTALGYSRDSGQTSDHFLDIVAQRYEPQFLRYVPDAFSPVGLMLNEWGVTLVASRPHGFSVIAINDLDKDWRGVLELRIAKDGKAVSKATSQVFIPAYGKTPLTVPCSVPKEKGTYTVEAVLKMPNNKEVKSVRELPVE